MPSRPRLAVDFDGTIFDGKNILPGCVEVLTRLRLKYRIAIFSARATASERNEMTLLLIKNEVPYDEILDQKPEFEFLIDDRAIRFESWEKVSL